MDRLLRSTPANIARDNYATAAIEDADDWSVAIEKAEYVEAHILRLTFNDGAERLVDFGHFLSQSHNPHIRKYLDPALFQRFTLADGDLFWQDYDLCFPIADLYEGQI